MKFNNINFLRITLNWKVVCIYFASLLFFVSSCVKPVNPEVVGEITGDSIVVYGEQGVQYSLTKPSGVDYVLWSVPEQAEIKSGQGTATIVVDFKRNAGNICANFYFEGKEVSTQSSCKQVSFGATNTWARMLDFMGRGRGQAVGFSIGNKGYIGTGIDDMAKRKNDLWEFDPDSVTWTQKMNMSNNMADLETNKRYEAFGFSIGNRGYVGTGFSGAGNSYSDFWEYNPADNTWSKKDDFPGGPRQYSFTFVIGGKGYVGGGYTGNTLNVFKDFYEYNPLTGHWTTKDSIPIPISYATAFSINDKGYVATGNKNGAASQDVYEYNSQTDTWAQKNIFPGNARFGASSFSIGEKGYLGFGTNGGSSFGDIYNDFWEYNPINDVWVQRITPPVPAAARFYAVGFSIGNSGYIGTGHTTTSDLLSDFWTFVP